MWVSLWTICDSVVVKFGRLGCTDLMHHVVHNVVHTESWLSSAIHPVDNSVDSVWNFLIRAIKPPVWCLSGRWVL